MRGMFGWAGRWSLLGDFVLCACLAAQAIGMAQEPFEHALDCVAGSADFITVMSWVTS